MFPWGCYCSLPYQLNSHCMSSRQFPSLQVYQTVSVLLRGLRHVWSNWGRGITEVLGFFHFMAMFFLLDLEPSVWLLGGGREPVQEMGCRDQLYLWLPILLTGWLCGKLLIFISIKSLLFLFFLFPLLNSFIIHWILNTISCHFSDSADSSHFFSCDCLGRLRSWQSQKL